MTNLESVQPVAFRAERAVTVDDGDQGLEEQGFVDDPYQISWN